jgi:hypothetical protein
MNEWRKQVGKEVLSRLKKIEDQSKYGIFQMEKLL